MAAELYKASIFFANNNIIEIYHQNRKQVLDRDYLLEGLLVGILKQGQQGPQAKLSKIT